MSGNCQIEDHGIEEIALGQPREGVAAVGGRFHGHAPLLAALRDDAPVGGIVFDDQQALARKLGLRRCQAGGVVAAGARAEIVKWNVAPLPASLSTQIFPPSNSARRLQMARPSPVPP